MTAPTVAGRYRLDAQLARGGSAEVWRATDLVLARPVALKLLRAGSDEQSRERFRAEARHAGALQHPGIAAVHDFGESDDGVSAWLVMELVDGEPLSAVLQRDGALPVDRALDVVAQAADALQAAHALGVVHRDVKPGNLMVRRDGTVKVTDFGIARLASPGDEQTTGLVVGTAAYLSPEQAAGRPVSPASDVYALGVVAYECLTGARPFPGATPADVAQQHLHDEPPPLPPTVPHGVSDLVERCLEKDPGDRPEDAGVVARQARALRAAATPDDVSDRSARPQRQHRPHRRALRLALPLLLVALLALGARSFLSGGGRSVDVPLVRSGSSAVEAERLLLDAGLEVRWRTEVDPEVPEGYVVRTEPAGGSRVPGGSEVAVVTSGEVLVGRPYEEVREVLERRQLSPRPVLDGEGGPPGTVRSLEPEGPLEPGSEVVVHVVPGR